MVKLLVLLLFILLIACKDDDALNLNGYLSAAPVKEEKKIDRSFSRKGNMIKDVGYMENKYITMWDNYFGVKQSVYRLQPGEKVIVYGKNGEYVFLAPQSDTNLTGYVLAGWIEFDAVNKVNNVRQVAAIPDYNPRTLNKETSSEVDNIKFTTPFTPNLTRLFKKHEKKLKVKPVVYDEHHILQDELELPKRPDTAYNLNRSRFNN